MTTQNIDQIIHNQPLDHITQLAGHNLSLAKQAMDLRRSLVDCCAAIELALAAAEPGPAGWDGAPCAYALPPEVIAQLQAVLTTARMMGWYDAR